MHGKVFGSLLTDLTPVLTDADKYDVLGQEVIPLDFHEANPDEIVQAYQVYVKANGDAKTTSVASKLSQLNYHTPYDLFHDVKLASGISIIKHEVGSKEYVEIDAFFRFATDLLLREISSMGLKMFQEKERDDDDTLGIFSEDFQKISSNHLVANGEFVTYLNKYSETTTPLYHSAYSSQQQPETKTVVQPLFSGLIGKSILDTRNTIVPEPWSLSKAIASGINQSASGTLKSFNNIATKIPLPSQSSSQVLDGFFHPNWYTIEAPKWLNYKQKTLKPRLDSTLVKNSNANELRLYEKRSNVSLGPSSDSTNSVLSETLKQKVWFSSVGFEKINRLSKGEKTLGEGSVEVSSETNQDGIEPSRSAEVLTVAKESEMTSPGYASNEIKLENLVQFDPEVTSTLESLREDKKQITSSPAELQKVISSNLLKLSKLRQERYLHSTSPGTPTSTEFALYKKIVKLLSLLVKANGAMKKEISLRLSKKLPVLLNDYSGVLPGPIPSQTTIASKGGRLASIRGPYKKKGRFM